MPALAQGTIVTDHRDPEARLEVYVDSIHIYDDHDDWDEGEINITALVMHQRECPPAERGDFDYCRDVVVSSTIKFNANDGDTVPIHRVIPGPGDRINDSDGQTGPGIGFPGRPDHGYIVAFIGVDTDAAFDDSLGGSERKVNRDNGWGPLGSYNERGQLCTVDGIFNITLSCGHPAAFSVKYTVRQVALPDLRPTGFSIIDNPSDTNDQVCMLVENVGITAAQPFRLHVQLDNEATPLADMSAASLAAGQSREQCAVARLPNSGPHQIVGFVDRPREVPEMNEDNNGLYTTISRDPPPTGSPGPVDPSHPGAVVSPSGVADLTVSALRVNGQIPYGQDVCTAGTSSAVVIVVNNVGTASSAGSTLRLVVDNGQPIDKAVTGLDTGTTQEVRFDNLSLAKGDHTLKATVDPQQTVSELNEGNNLLQTTARCKDAAPPPGRPIIER